MTRLSHVLSDARPRRTPPPSQIEFRFDGDTFDPDLDGTRLFAQLKRVRALMGDGAWRTLAEISAATADPEASISARLRDLRKPKFGAFTIERRRRGEAHHGLFEYRLAEHP
jgi:hypothetical protein